MGKASFIGTPGLCVFALDALHKPPEKPLLSPVIRKTLTGLCVTIGGEKVKMRKLPLVQLSQPGNSSAGGSPLCKQPYRAIPPRKDHDRAPCQHPRCLPLREIAFQLNICRASSNV